MAVGDVLRIDLPDGEVAHGRVLRDSSLAVYRGVRRTEEAPPVGRRDYQFVVGIYEDGLRQLPVVGQDPPRDEADSWPPPYSVTDPVTGRRSVYERGQIRPASEDLEDLEPAAVWDLSHIVERISANRD
jgi:hypothetical protein